MANTDIDILKDACGLFGVAVSSTAARRRAYESICFGLLALQHRYSQTVFYVLAFIIGNYL